MKPEEMNEGVRILLDRMETHPEEFSYGIREKWAYHVQEIMKHSKGEPNEVPFLYDEEVKALYDKLRDLERNEFTAQILRQLANTPEEYEQLDLPYMPSMPRRTYELNLDELKKAMSLGVSPEVYAEARQREIQKQREAYHAAKGTK